MKLRVGDWVEVRPVGEILSTLDENGALDGLPFMPEMLQYCGKRFRVFKSAHKTCDTIENLVIRRMDDAVHLEGVRCDGQAHGGCEALCTLFWKRSWLKKVEGPKGDNSDLSKQSPLQQSSDTLRGLAMLNQMTRQAQTEPVSETVFRCQATDLLKATSEVRRRERWNPFFYLRDVTSGNFAAAEFLTYGFLAIVNAFTGRWFGRRFPNMCGLAGRQTPSAQMDLQPGELVRVRSKADIMQTLNTDLRNRGLWFDVEMLPHCESNRQVLRRVEKIVDEKTGRLVRFPNPCIILDGVTCSGKLTPSRMFCPRSTYPYWREIWLERAKGH